MLVQMELFDTFGQRTTLRLSHFVRNPSIAPSRFKFTPPKGADVIGEGLVGAGQGFDELSPNGGLDRVPARA